MERLDLDLNAFSRRAGSMEVAHSTTRLARGLEPGERVLVRDGEEYLIATVRDISFDLTDTHYRLELGAAVTHDDVAMLLAETSGSGPIDLSAVLGLLRDARHLASRRSYLADAVTP
ncbi:hypothetical protein [Nocardioides nematodiphilus]|uniref:hypothetical protein n=1 Tax=Nocardioides nematodiphilus TaxID=2849669 RepID=UPI001CD93F08|nr:hypothetical protein [Nocardioides nematodiphilus]MCA1983185.1 hypothetical protein [Nocardioides nematodiphilus]